MTLRCGASAAEQDGEEADAADVGLVVDGHPADVKLLRHGEQWLIAGMGD